MSGGVWMKCSSSPISTDKKKASSYAGGLFLVSGDTRLRGKRFSFSTPVSFADSPFQGHAACALGSGRWLRCIDFLAEVSLPLATAADFNSDTTNTETYLTLKVVITGFSAIV